MLHKESCAGLRQNDHLIQVLRLEYQAHGAHMFWAEFVKVINEMKCFVLIALRVKILNHFICLAQPESEGFQHCRRPNR